MPIRAGVLTSSVQGQDFMNDNRRRVILVVEDEPFIQMLIADFLEELGYATLVASDAKSALISLEADGELDLLLTDIGLPDMNGWALAEIARNLRPSLPILFATGYGEQNAKTLAPGTAMIAKPFDVERLAENLRTLLTRM